MKRFILGAVILMGVLVSSLSADISKMTRYNVYQLRYFDYPTSRVKDTLIQNNTKEVTNFKYSYACGPTSLLFVRNYYHFLKYYEHETFLLDVGDSTDAIKRLYNYINVPYTSNLSSVTSLSDLKNIAENRWNWNNAAKSGTNYSYNLTRIKEHLKSNRPLIIALSPNTTNDINHRARHSLNPVGNNGHIVIVFAYIDYKDTNKDDIIFYYDPYFGEKHYIYESEFRRASMGSTMAYLIVSP
jgi:hypothetical protein